MNCKPGDLAIIVKGDVSERNIGRVVRVVRHSSVYGEGWWWVEMQSPGVGSRQGVRVIVSEGNIHDSRLRPIRDPGDDAVDETLLWLPAPTTETA